MHATVNEVPLRSLAEELRDPAAYPHPVHGVDVVETHISWVFLAGDFAYKVKKPVRLPFLDFSTLSERYYYCQEEVRLNRRSAPEIYLDVVPIGGHPARVGGPLPAREYAVRMRRFPEHALLDVLACEDRLTSAHVDGVAAALARLHGTAVMAGTEKDFGSAAHVTRAALANFDELAAMSPPESMAAALEALRTWTRQQAHDLVPRFEARRAGGFVRECHGDLHLGNVVLIDGRPRLFDCIEFSAGLRWTDVMADVGFLFMDLLHRGHPRLAYRFVDAYLAATGDYDGLGVLRFYAVYRAMVRGKVAFIRARQLGAADDGARHEFIRYVALAERLSRREPPVLMLMHGFAASGKTTASQRLLEALGAVRLRADVERKRMHGIVPASRAGADAPGHGMYSQDETDRTYARLEALAREVLDAGYPVVVDATFLEHDRRRRFRDLAEEAHAAFEVVSCVVPAQVLRERIERRLRKGDDASDAGLAVLERQLQRHDPLDGEEMVHATLLDTTRESQWQGAVSSLARRFRMPLGEL